MRHLRTAFGAILLAKGLSSVSAQTGSVAVQVADSNGDPLCNFGCLRHWWGEMEEALEWLHPALDRGFASDVIADDADLDTLRNDPAFEAIVAEVAHRTPTP